MTSSSSTNLIKQTANQLSIRHPDSARRSIELRYTFLVAVVMVLLGVGYASVKTLAPGAVCAGLGLVLAYFTATFSHPYSYTVTPAALILEQHSLWRKKIYEVPRACLSGLWLALGEPERFLLYLCERPAEKGAASYRCIAIFWSDWAATRKVAEKVSAILKLPWQLAVVTPAEVAAPPKPKPSSARRPPQPAKGPRPADRPTADARRLGPSEWGADLSRFLPLHDPTVWFFDRAQGKIIHQTRIAGITEYPLEEVADFELEPEAEGIQAKGERAYRYSYQILLVLHSRQCLLVKKYTNVQSAKTLTSKSHHEAQWTLGFLRDWLAGRK
jgi:hypothetical protein